MPDTPILRDRLAALKKGAQSENAIAVAANAELENTHHQVEELEHRRARVALALSEQMHRLANLRTNQLHLESEFARLKNRVVEVQGIRERALNRHDEYMRMIQFYEAQIRAPAPSRPPLPQVS